MYRVRITDRVRLVEVLLEETAKSGSRFETTEAGIDCGFDRQSNKDRIV